MKIIKTLFGAAALATAATTAFAQANPAIIFDLGGKFDKSFNESSFEGAEKFKAETGIEYREFELQSDAQREQAIRRFAQQGNNPVVMAGFSFGTALDVVAQEFPDTSFVIIDMVVDQPNVRSVLFSAHEGSYLVGMLASMASETGTVGFIGGMDIPLISQFGCGYTQGARAANGDAVILQNSVGTTGAAWNDPVKGGELAMAQFEQGADVIFVAAGGTGRGVLQAAADSGNLAIGVDSNQNYMQPGSVLTSMVKRVDEAVYNAFSDVNNGEFTAGFNIMNLSNNGVGFALDEHNDALVTDDMRAAVASATAKIISGEVVVYDFMSDNTCPVE
ncbi:BMP family ABC transporter substrate-binding protein [Rhodobacterales bacterium 52_120_T64]|nr:BMP family ABC transporter substrate-binding protein [Rhodobacterales bacterium 52_120_T64]